MIDAGEGYRTLAVGEVYREGDEGHFGAWYPTTTVGVRVVPGSVPVRRKVRPANAPGWRYPDSSEAITADWRLGGALEPSLRTPAEAIVGRRVERDSGPGEGWIAPWPDDPRLKAREVAPMTVSEIRAALPWRDPKPPRGKDWPEHEVTPVTETREDRYQRRLDAMLAGMPEWRLPRRVGAVLRRAEERQRADNNGTADGCSHLGDVRDLYRPRAGVGFEPQYSADAGDSL